MYKMVKWEVSCKTVTMYLQYFESYKLNQGNQTTEAVREYSTNFMSYIGMAAQFPNAIMNCINLFCQCG